MRLHPVRTQKSLGFFNQLFLVPKPSNRPESLEKVIPIPRLPKVVVSGKKMFFKVNHYTPSITLYKCLPMHQKKDGKYTARETWSLIESKLHINYLEVKAVFQALKEFQDLCSDKIILVATDNTTMVA